MFFDWIKQEHIDFQELAFYCFLLALSLKLYLLLLRRKEWKETLLFINMLPVLQIH